MYRKALNELVDANIKVLILTPLLTGAAISAQLEQALAGIAPPKPEEEEEIVLPAPVLYDCFARLVRFGELGREWITAIAACRINGKLVASSVHSVECEVSDSTGAEVDYGHLSRVLQYFRACGFRIVAIAHIHPWDAEDVQPSMKDIETQRRWERIHRGFVGIVFTNSGVFRIFTAGSNVSVRITGDGVETLGENLHRLTRAEEVREWGRGT